MQRYLGIDVHSESSTIYVMSAAGKKVRQDVVETNGQALIGHLAQIPGQLHVCLEEGEWSAWLHEILEPHVAELVVEQPQSKAGSKSDAIDARDLAEHLRTGQIETEVYKAPRRFTRLRELARTYDMLTEDAGRAKNRLRSAYRRRAVGYPGHGLAAQSEALPELPAWMRQSVEALGIELASIEELRGEIEEAMIAESRRHPISRILRTAPGMGPIRVAQLIPIVITPHRFRTKRQFWAYCGFGLVTRTSADWVKVGRQWVRVPVQQTRGLNRDCNRRLKRIFKGAAMTVIRFKMKPLWTNYVRLTENGTRPNLARLTVARKLAATVLAMWKKKERYHPKS